MKQDIELFEQRKKDHVRLALDPKNQSDSTTELEQISLVHDSLPDLNFNEISIQCESKIFGTTVPFFIAGMTAGHAQAQEINHVLAALASERQWVLGVGSQRREFESLLEGSAYSDSSTSALKAQFPNLKLVSNLGIAQVVEAFNLGQLGIIEKLAERIGALAICIHLNPLQEAIQEEGTPNFKNSLNALEALSVKSPIPIIVKETGSGMSKTTLKKISSLSLAAVDVSGLGGTHWGKIEGQRAESLVVNQIGETFQDWGVTTVQSVCNAKKTLTTNTTEIWASGGVRSGLEAAKLIALGANRVGFAMPALKAAMEGEGVLDLWMEKIERELKIAMFCTNSKNIFELNLSKVSHE